MSQFGLSYNTRKALSVHLGDEAGGEIINLIQRMAQRIDALERNKVNVTHIVPSNLATPPTSSPRSDFTN